MEMRRKYGVTILEPLKRGLNQIHIKGNVCKKRFGTSPEKDLKTTRKNV